MYGVSHHIAVIWGALRLKSPTAPLFVKQFVHVGCQPDGCYDFPGFPCFSFFLEIKFIATTNVIDRLKTIYCTISRMVVIYSCFYFHMILHIFRDIFIRKKLILFGMGHVKYIVFVAWKHQCLPITKSHISLEWMSNYVTKNVATISECKLKHVTYWIWNIDHVSFHTLLASLISR